MPRLKIKAHPALSILPTLTKAEIDRAADRVRLYGQKQKIETLDGAIVGGLEEHEGCLAAGIKPKLTPIKKPSCIVEYVLRQLPRNFTGLDRAVIAVLAEEMYKVTGRARMRDAGRIGGKLKGPRTVREPFGHENWYETAARVVGTTPGAVKRLATLRRIAPDVFDAVRDRKLTMLREARDLAHALPTREARSKVLALRKKHPSLPVARLIADVMRAERPRLSTASPPEANGHGWVVYEGPLAKVGGRIPDKTIDLVHADIVYGHVDMAEEIAKLAKRVLVDGGFLAMIAGHDVLDTMNGVAKHLTPIAIGAYHVLGGAARRPGPVQRVDVLPVLIFGKGRVRQIAHLAFIGEREHEEAKRHSWQKDVATTRNLIASMVPRGSRVLDPCCGTGTTGIAAIEHGCEFIGIDVDPDAVKMSRARLAAAEMELRRKVVTPVFRMKSRAA